jgi:pilus assembly protein CpaC
MTNIKMMRQKLMAGALVAGLILTGTVTTPAFAQSNRSQGQTTTNAELLLSVGRGRLITLPTPMNDVFVANQEVADVQVRSSTQLYVFGKAPGETSIYATDAAGRVVYSVVARVGNNIETIDQMLLLAMPDAQINVNTMNGFVLLTGTVASPQDAAEADRLVSAFVGEGTRVISRLQTATPLQVNLQVRIAEVNRSLVREIGGNLLSRDNSGGQFLFGAFRGRNIGSISTPDPVTGAVTVSTSALIDKTTLTAAGRLLGVDLLGALDMGERTGMVATLAQPNLTTVSGETADFLAGGEFPIPVPNPMTGNITIEYRKFGVSLAYTPTVLSNGRISLRVRPEVSELSTEGAIRVNGFEIPALSVRRTETTVELGSGESFMIAGLMSNRSVSAVDATPGLGQIPILGTLFRSDTFRRGDSELVIVVTPYLVRPVNADQIVLPTDGFRSATDMQRGVIGQSADGETGARRPMPQMVIESETSAAPGIASAPVTPATAAAPTSIAPQANAEPERRRRRAEAASNAAPGFSFNQ